MPPKICSALSVTRASASEANSLAMAASESVMLPWSHFQAACKVSSSAAASSVAISASLKPVPWNLPIDWPNCLRVAAHSVAISITR